MANAIPVGQPQEEVKQPKVKPAEKSEAEVVDHEQFIGKVHPEFGVPLENHRAWRMDRPFKG